MTGKRHRLDLMSPQCKPPTLSITLRSDAVGKDKGEGEAHEANAKSNNN